MFFSANSQISMTLDHSYFLRYHSPKNIKKMAYLYSNDVDMLFKIKFRYTVKHFETQNAKITR